jgi:predicted lipoprotein with Yx(FWY)xxD motif
MSRSFRTRFTAVALGLAALGSSTIAVQAQAADAPAKATITIKVVDSKLGPIMVDEKGMSLYMFTPDAPNVSVCEGGCLTAWPPIMLKADETLANVKLEGGNLRRSKLGVAMRFDGSRQVTYNGWPLYYWIRDKVAGDVSGQWVGNVWFVLNGEGTPVGTRLPAA